MNPAPGPVTAAAAAAARAIAGRRAWFCDLDGTLVDSGPVHEAAFRDAITEIAPELLGSFRYDAHAGTGTREVVAGLGAAGDVARRLVRRKQELYRGYVDAGMVAPFPGARRLLDLLADRGRTPYLVTGGSRGSVERVLAACSLGGCFRGVLTADDVPWNKPDPRFYLRACRDWAVPPDGAVAVEDSVHGVASAVGAGLVTLQVHAAGPAAGAVAVRDLDEIASLLEAEDGGGFETEPETGPRTGPRTEPRTEPRTGLETESETEDGDSE
ncbi:HAD-IA family hydrolase [Planomonospora sp. ID91781]|uniref:HAD family hydrolase n=1 Tax=Planomonospora sp. ID91781 TaxID=2738135 RepID=UPI0018C3C18D|nr:HAD family hydrolase [Planomonospora sp. ID91781]MBG0822868.1 HAD-IA family hydrolase [Planomonospora sp. ID91781]